MDCSIISSNVLVNKNNVLSINCFIKQKSSETLKNIDSYKDEASFKYKYGKLFLILSSKLHADN